MRRGQGLAVIRDVTDDVGPPHPGGFSGNKSTRDVSIDGVTNERSASVRENWRSSWTIDVKSVAD